MAIWCLNSYINLSSITRNKALGSYISKHQYIDIFYKEQENMKVFYNIKIT